MANYFQTDDMDDYFESLSKTRKTKIKPLYSVSINNEIILNNVENYKGITFTKTLIEATRKSLNGNRWIGKLKELGYTITQSPKRLEGGKK